MTLFLGKHQQGRQLPVVGCLLSVAVFLGADFLPIQSRGNEAQPELTGTPGCWSLDALPFLGLTPPSSLLRPSPPPPGSLPNNPAAHMSPSLSKLS